MDIRNTAKTSCLSCYAIVLLCIVYAQSAYSKDINFSHFQFSKPGSKKLEAQLITNKQAVFSYTSKRKRVHYQMTFVENVITDSSQRNMTAREVADHYREGEHQNMIEMGVKSGMYELENLKNGEEELGSNHFYTMSYETKDREVIQSAKLYLYFPNEQSVTHFLVAHYSESAADKKNISTAYQESFLSSLASVTEVLTEFEKFYYMTDGTNITPCEITKDPSLVLAKLENEGMICAESPSCPTCGCFEFFAAQICSCQNSVEWTISFFDEKEHCKRARK